MSTECPACGDPADLPGTETECPMHAYPVPAPRQELGAWSDPAVRGAVWDLVAELVREYGLCEWFAGCDRQADGTVAHPILGPVPTCQRCAERFGLELTR